jgi:D-glycero-D-manno-heptose 1,7-bisphosphate phosphatase
VGIKYNILKRVGGREMRRALFLDRDGVVNIDHGYVESIERFELVPGITDLIMKAAEKGYMPIVITNQSGIGRGYYNEEDFEKVTEYMLSLMQGYGIEIDRSHVLHCPHAPEEKCICRKPEPGMFLRAISRFDIDPAVSWMIGDKKSDIEAARRAGIGHTLLVESNSKIDMEKLDGF